MPDPLPFSSVDSAAGGRLGGAERTGLGSGSGALPEVPSPPLGGFAPVWLQRLSLFVLVLFCVYLGVLVTVLPWWSRIWDHNAFIQARPMLARVLHNGAVRGMVSGLGLLDIWIGLSEAIHYRDFRP